MKTFQHLSAIPAFLLQSLIAVSIGIIYFSPAYAIESITVASLSEDDFLADVPVVLTATRLAQPITEAPAAITIIDREMILASGAREIAELFALVPGFIVSHEDGHTPIVMYHGLVDEYARRMQVLVDGRSVYSSTIGGVDWANLPLTVDDIQRIEVIRGPNAASYGSNSFLSIINIITLHSSETTGAFAKVTRGTNEINDGYMRFGNTVDDLSYRISLAYNHDEGFETRDDTRTVRMARFRVDYQANDSNTILIQTGINKGPREYRNDTLESTVDRKINDYFGQIQWSHQINAKEDISLQFFYNAENREEFFDVTTPNIAPFPVRVVADNSVHGERYDIEFQHSLSVATHTRVVWGLGARQDSAYGVDVFGTNSETGYTGGKKIYYNTMLRAFGNLEWQLNEKLLVNMGAMLENSDIAGKQFSPRLGLNYLIDQKQSLRISASRATRTPTIREVYDNYRVPIYFAAPPQPLLGVTTLWVGNDNLKPEVITAYEFGYHANLSRKKMSFDLKLYREELRNLISLDENQVLNPSDPVDGEHEIADNLTDSNITGIEAALEFKPSADSRIILSHSHINIKSKNPNISSEKLAESAPKYISSLMAINQFPGHITGSLLYSSVSKSNGLGSGDPVDGHQRLDIRFGYTFINTNRIKGEVSLVIQNLLDDYIDWRTDNTAETQQYISVSAQWN